MKDKIEQAAQEYTEIGRSYLLASEMPVVQDAFKAGADLSKHRIPIIGQSGFGDNQEV
ncbi:hypothetical protein [Prevotella disiens]|uniref:hypothetical protein n=1 Tax=Prevotella disiens TaxID=28130 RepID=UPI00242FD9A8|nr:hypothetical protein [Prevotella disiens]